MKKFCLLLAFFMLFSALTGCSSKKPAAPSTEPSTQPSAPSTEPSTEPTTEPTEPPIPQVIGYDVELPEEFIPTVATNQQMFYESPDAPKDPSCIEISIYERDASLLTMDADAFKASRQVEGEFYSLELKIVQIGGIDTLFADYVLDQGRIWTHVYEYHVVASQNYMFRFADSTDKNDWLESFAAAAQTITLILEDEPVELDFSGLTKYRLDCGVSLYARHGMEKQNAPGFTEALGSREAIILVMQDNKKDNDLDGLDIDEYAKLVSDTNELEPFTLDTYGNLQTCFYSTDEAGQEYYNMLTAKETEDSFWIFQMTCTADKQTSYTREFSLWSASITE